MKFRLVVLMGLMLSALLVQEAKADYYTCSLSASANYVPVGQTFSYTINVGFVQTLPSPGPYPPRGPVSVVFYGTKNGISDIAYPGESYPGLFPLGTSVLTGYGNPGGASGFYTRYAFIYFNGNAVCVTNQIGINLQ
jgi:hypothetical protein